MCDLWLVATKATMATLGTPPQQNISPGIFFGWFVITTHLLSFYFIFKFQLGVAMVAMVALKPNNLFSSFSPHNC